MNDQGISHCLESGHPDHTFSFTAGVFATIPTILGMVIEEVRAIFAPPLTFFDPISIFALGTIENLSESVPTAGKSL